MKTAEERLIMHNKLSKERLIEILISYENLLGQMEYPVVWSIAERCHHCNMNGCDKCDNGITKTLMPKAEYLNKWVVTPDKEKKWCNCKPVLTETVTLKNNTYKRCRTCGHVELISQNACKDLSKIPEES